MVKFSLSCNEASCNADEYGATDSTLEVLIPGFESQSSS